MLNEFAGLSQRLSGQFRRRLLSTSLEDLKFDLFKLNRSPSKPHFDSFVLKNDIPIGTEKAGSLHLETPTNSASNSILPNDDCLENTKLQSSSYLRDKDRKLLFKTVSTVKNSEELLQFLSTLFQDSMKNNNESETFKNVVLDKALIIAILNRCERLMDMRLPWILISQIRLLNHNHVKDIIDIDVYNAILRIIVRSPENILKIKSFKYSRLSNDTKDVEHVSLLSGRFKVCASLVERVLYETHRLKLRWNLDTYDILIQLHLMEGQLLKANRLVNQLSSYVHYLRKLSIPSRTPMTSSASLRTMPVFQEKDRYFEGNRLYVKYRNIIANVQAKHREELLDSSPLIAAEKRNDHIIENTTLI